jgi:hypothetical protein
MHVGFAINVTRTAKNRMHTLYELYVILYGETINVVLTAENQSYVRIENRTVNAPCSY